MGGHDDHHGLGRHPADVLDHNFPSYAEAEVVPHGIYDVGRNRLHVHLTTGSDTGEFADSVRVVVEGLAVYVGPSGERNTTIARVFAKRGRDLFEVRDSERAEIVAAAQAAIDRAIQREELLEAS